MATGGRTASSSVEIVRPSLVTRQTLLLNTTRLVMEPAAVDLGRGPLARQSAAHGFPSTSHAGAHRKGERKQVIGLLEDSIAVLDEPHPLYVFLDRLAQRLGNEEVGMLA